MNAGEMRIDPRTCIRCGACAILAPGIVAVGRGGPARVVRAPATDVDARRARAAHLTCPVGAVRERDDGST
jgi:ferredoxin